MTLVDWIRLAGAGQLSILVASALVPAQLGWKPAFAALPRLLRQMYWIYGAYVAGVIVAFGVGSLALADELVSGSPLARAVSGLIAAFWGARLTLVPFLDARPYLRSGWLRLGYRALTVMFAFITAVFACAAVG